MLYPLALLRGWLIFEVVQNPVLPYEISNIVSRATHLEGISGTPESGACCVVAISCEVSIAGNIAQKQENTESREKLSIWHTADYLLVFFVVHNYISHGCSETS